MLEIAKQHREAFSQNFIMSKKAIVFGFFALLLLTSTAFGQRSRPSRSNSGLENSFIVGAAPFSLLTRSGKINLRGEWRYRPKASVSVLLGVPRKTKLPGFIDDDIVVETGNNGKSTENSWKVFGLTVENRYYFLSFSTKPIGFYLAPYLRYNRFAIAHTSTYSDTGYETGVTGSFGGFGVGGAFGGQMSLGNNIVLDFTLAGLDLKWFRGSLRYTNTDPNNNLADFQKKVEDSVGGIPILGSLLKTDIDANSVRVRTPGLPLLGFRFNMTVGYIF